MAVTNGWGKGAQNSTNGWGKSGTNNIGYGAIYESSPSGDTALIGTSAAFLYSKSSFNQGEADPTPTITGTAGGSFNASEDVVFVDTGTFNSSTGQIDLSATSIGSHIITYTVNGVQSGQTVGVTAVPYASTSSFSFDGINDYFDIGNDISVSGNCTVSFWFKVPAIPNATPEVMFARYTGSGDTDFFIIGLYLQGVLASNNSNAGGSKTTRANITLSPNTWHHCAVTKVSGVVTNIYIDGTDRAGSVGSFEWWGAGSTDSGFIGQKANADSLFDGNIDELSIWNTTLSQSAVTEIYNSGAPNDLTSLSNASNTNLKAWYKF